MTRRIPLPGAELPGAEPDPGDLRPRADAQVTHAYWLPEGRLEDLARGALGQLVHEPDLARVLVRRQPLAAVGDDLLRGHLGPGAPDHHGHHLLPEPLD